MRLSRLRALLAATAAVLSGSATGQGLGQPLDLERRVVATQKDAIALMPAEVVCEPMILNMAFSDSGRYLLLTRQAAKLNTESFSAVLAGRKPPPVETSIVLWDARDRVSRTLWKTTGENVQIRTLRWLPGTDVALALTNELQLIPPPRGSAPNVPPRPTMKQQLLRVLPGGDRPQVLASADDMDREALDLQVSHTSPAAVLRRDVRPQEQAGGPAQLEQFVTMIGPEGRLGKTFPVDPDLTLFMVEWTADGKPLLLGFTQRTAGQQPAQKRLLLDTRTGATSLFEGKPALPAIAQLADASPKLGVRLKQGRSSVKEAETMLPVGTLWLEAVEPTEQPRVLVSADSSGGHFAPGGESVLFHSQGALLAAQLIRIDKQVLAAAREQARRMLILNNGKQIGLAAHMFAADHDDALPGSDDVNAKLGPYVKNQSIFEGFTYTFGGGPMKDVEKPAETELGFVTGPGGRAVIYVDGHVKWKPDR